MLSRLPIPLQLLIPRNRTLPSDDLGEVPIIVTRTFLHLLLTDKIGHAIPIEYFLLRATLNALIAIPLAILGRLGLLDFDAHL